MSVVCSISFDCTVSVSVEVSWMWWIHVYTKSFALWDSKEPLAGHLYVSGFPFRLHCQRRDVFSKSHTSRVRVSGRYCPLLFLLCKPALNFLSAEEEWSYQAPKGRYICLSQWAGLSEHLSSATTAFHSLKEERF